MDFIGEVVNIVLERLELFVVLDFFVSISSNLVFVHIFFTPKHVVCLQDPIPFHIIFKRFTQHF